jgi:hypothetical protein
MGSTGNMRRRFHKRNRPSGSFGFLLATLIVTCLLLVLNVTFVRFFHLVLAERWVLLAGPKATQLAMLLGPLMLVGFEWWVVDVIVNRVSKSAG